MSQIYFNLAGGNLVQDWSNTGLITADDDWSNVPSFQGFLGQDITTTTGANPGTLLTDSTVASDLDVQHGETNPNSFTTGGVAEFEIANPTIALNGSGTADAPHLVMYLNATGRENLVVSFDARDLDSSVDNAIQPIAVQYRIGETGAWTNLPPAGGAATDPQIADATTGPSLATLVTPITITLPSAVNNQAQVQVRFITANAVNNDEWVGIDNINVTSDQAPQSVGFASNSLVVAKSEGDGGSTAFTFTVERSGTTDGDVDFTVSLTSAIANSADFAGSPALPLAINGTILAGQASATFTVNVNGDTDVEVNENFTLAITNVVNATAPAAINTNQDEATGRILTDDFAGTDIGGVAVLAEAASLQGATATPSATNGIELVRLGSYAAAGGNAEVVSFDPTTDQLYILNTTGNKIEIVQIGSSGALTKTGEINLAGLTEFGGANSVAIKNGIVAVAYGNSTVGDNGYVALFNAAGVLQSVPPIEVGVLPDMLTFTPDGSKIIVANEAEAVSTSSNANGTISIIDVSGGAAAASVQSTVGFTALNGSEAALDGALGLSLFPGQSAAADIEPEYIAVSPDGTRAYVTLQEVNAVAVIDLTNPAATGPLAILPLGSVDRSLAGNAFDPSDQDGIDIGTWSGVRSLLQPDSIATFSIGGETYFVTANEGDARVGTGLTGEEVRLSNGSYNLDDATFPTEAALKENGNLGRLNVINHEGDTNGDGNIDVITTYGGRGISIFKQNADGSIEKVRETGGEFERILSQQPNANLFFNGENAFGTFDSRSDNKGPEPEGVDVGVINGHTYAFVTLERAGGVMIYDVTNPATATFVGYKPPLPPTAQPSPDNAPETIKFISAADSPTGTALVITANEVGNATTVYAAVTPIYQIQGSGHLSALDGQSVSTTGVVTAVDSNGFYIQDPNGDGNAATSDGIFVFTSVAPTVVVGQSVMVTGAVDEFVPSGAAPGFLPVTQIVAQNANVLTLGLGQAITPVEIGGAGHLAPPTSDISDGAAFFEALEGMLVKVNNPIVVAPTNSNGEIFTVVDNDDNPANGVNATGLNARGVLQLTPGTPVADDPLTTGSDALRTVNTTGGDFNPERIQIDDDSGVLAGFVSPAVNPGAHLQSVTGVVSYNFANYEVIATQAYGVAQASTLAKETTTLTGTANRLTVASYNAENLDHLDPGARFTTIASEVVNRLKSPDIIALQEIQDNDGAANSSTTGANLTLQDLVVAINSAAAPGVVYAFIDNPFIGDDSNGGEPGGNIRTAFLYRTDRVDLVDNSLRTIGVNGVSIDTPGSAGALDQQTNPENPFFGSRPPLVATFDFNGNEVTIVNNHFTSKGGSGAVIGSVEPPLNASEVQRAAQAQAVNNFVDNLLAGDATAKIMVAGDLNEFPSEEPMNVLKGTATITNYDVPASDPFDATATYVAGGTAILHDLLETLPANEQYDYVFDGNAQTLDHVLVTSNLATSAQFDVVRINAEFADQTSDHDPLIASFDLPAQTANYTLQLLHLSDGEAGLLASQTAPNLAALVDAFDDDFANTLILSGGDNWLPGPFAAAGTDLSVIPTLNAVSGSTIGATTNVPIAAVDIAIHNEMGVEISSIGNHEFDLGSRTFRDSFSPNLGAAGWVGANFVHVSANLDFSGDADLNPRFTNTLDGGTGTLIPEASTLKGRIAPAAVITKGGEKIGFVGATTQILESISSPSGTEVKGFPTGPGPNGEVDDMTLLAAQLQPIIDELIAEGVNKIILHAHLQQIANEQLLATKLRGVDIILSAGSNTRLGDADDEAVAFPGHAADFAGTYPLEVTDADGKTTLIINTDNEYTYLGRLVVEFDDNGDIIPSSLTANQAINGAYASTAENVAEAWNTTVGNLETTAFAEGTKGNEVRDLTTAVQSVINVKDGNVFGYTDVYLEGERGIIRNQETNLGDLSADANAWVAREALGDAPFLVSLKNGGGIRAQIGTLSPPDPVDGTVDKLPPPANPATGKPEGGVSQLDVENSLRFDNKLMVYDTTPQGLLNILNWGAGLGANNGGFPQIGGVKYSFDPDLPGNSGSTPGSRIRDVALTDEDGNVVAVLVDDGVVVAGAPALIRAVTLNFTANGGDGYPVKANGENFRYLLTDGTLSAPISEASDFTAPANVPANALGEQRAFGDYMDAFHGTPATAYDQADTSAALDTRIQNLNVRGDTVFDSPAIAGTQGDDVLAGTAGNDMLNGLGGNDFLVGQAFKDILTGGAGNDTIDGGTGADTAVFSGVRSQYQATQNPNGSVHITDLRAGAPDGTDDVGNVELFQFSDMTVLAANLFNSHAPVVTAADFSAARGQVINASSLFSASDADGDELLYFFYDNSSHPTSGHFTVNGMVQAAGTTFAVSAAQLAQTTFTAGSRLSDDLFVNAYDGNAFSGSQEFHVNVPANHAPVAAAADFSATREQVISASSLFSASDADGDGLLYFLYDSSSDPTSGHFTVNGMAQAAGTTFAVTAAQLAQTTFTAGTRVSDDLFVNAYDGTAFSGPQEFHVNVPANHAPTLTASNQMASSGQVLNASSLFSASDADGDSLLYFFYDNSAAATSGHFEVNGVTQAANTTFAVSAAQLAQTTFTAATAGGDDLFVNAYDGVAFSGPKEFHVDLV